MSNNKKIPKLRITEPLWRVISSQRANNMRKTNCDNWIIIDVILFTYVSDYFFQKSFLTHDNDNVYI